MNEPANLFTDGEAYETRTGRWSRLVGDEFIDWLAVPSGLRWLDVGCGNGALTERIINRCAPKEVIGIDPSSGQLAYARAKLGTSLAIFELGDAQSLAFANDSFDASAMALVIHFLPDPAAAVAEMARVVRPGGCVAAYVWDYPGGGSPVSPVLAAMKSLGMALPSPQGSATSQRDTLLMLWQSAGLMSTDTRVIRIEASYADFDEFWNSTTVGVGPLGKTINEMATGVREDLRSRLRERLAIGSDGRVTYEALANAVKGRVPS